MKTVKSPDGEMLTKPFLNVCRNVLPVIEKFGASMAIVKSDVGGNIAVLFSPDPLYMEYGAGTKM
jgi:precorrin-6B methylase 1